MFTLKLRDYLNTSILHNEKELLNRIAGGDESAFEQLFHAWHQKLGAYVYRLTESYEMAEDIVQVAFIKIWTNREKLVEIEHFDAYLFVLARNHTYNCLRRIAKEREKKAKIAAHIKECLKEEPFEAEISGYYALLDRAVNELSPQQQKVYVLSRQQRLKYSEIAQQMQISRETVKKYLQLATESIKKYLLNHKELLLILLFLSVAIGNQ